MGEIDSGINAIPYITTWELMVMLRRCHHQLEVYMDDALAELYITFAQYRALEALVGAKRPMHISYLARLMHVSRQAAQQSVRKLRLQGLVTLEPEGRDVVISLTPLARRRLELYRDATRSLHRGLERVLTPERLDA